MQIRKKFAVVPQERLEKLKRVAKNAECLLEHIEDKPAPGDNSYRAVRLDDEDALRESVAAVNRMASDASVYEAAIQKWGRDAQIGMVIEECAEVIKAIQKWRRGLGTVEDIMEELADVHIMSRQAEIIFDTPIEPFVVQKLKRLQETLAETQELAKEGR